MDHCFHGFFEKHTMMFGYFGFYMVSNVLVWKHGPSVKQLSLEMGVSMDFALSPKFSCQEGGKIRHITQG